MSAILSFALLLVLIVLAAWIVQWAKRFADGVDDRRSSLESLAGLCDSGEFTAAERRAVKSAVESQLRLVR